MGKVLPHITADLRAWIAKQHIYFVATAPSGAEGHVNMSPKGHMDTFAVLGGTTVAYLDLTGSGVETIAHLRDNGRITVMFCAFEGKPDVVRLQGSGRVVVPADPEFATVAAAFPARRNARAVIVVDVTRVSTSCGFSVPYLSYDGDRDLLEKWTDARDDAKISEYQQTRNAVSIDGLPGLPGAGHSDA
ncbi:MAG: Pyridoxamine 5-phosphate oxidase [Frankiales bacterium]|nr:Pyridoxamine 5-phosphate oxidase [Frankiales bacterium]